MKLYTKEMFLIASEKCEVSMIDVRHIMKYIDEYVIPIELPSDEEIELSYYNQLDERREIAKNFKGQVAGRHPDMFGHSEVHNMVRGYLECIGWLRGKIKGDNK